MITSTSKWSLVWAVMAHTLISELARQMQVELHNRLLVTVSEIIHEYS